MSWICSYNIRLLPLSSAPTLDSCNNQDIVLILGYNYNLMILCHNCVGFQAQVGVVHNFHMHNHECIVGLIYYICSNYLSIQKQLQNQTTV